MPLYRCKLARRGTDPIQHFYYPFKSGKSRLRPLIWNIAQGVRDLVEHVFVCDIDTLSSSSSNIDNTGDTNLSPYPILMRKVTANDLLIAMSVHRDDLLV